MDKNTNIKLLKLQKIFATIVRDLKTGAVELEEATFDMGDFRTVFRVSILDGSKLRKPIELIDEPEPEKNIITNFSDATYPDGIDSESTYIKIIGSESDFDKGLDNAKKRKNRLE